MNGLLEQMTEKALARNIPLSVQLDLTYRCNERCVHCYLDHEDHGEMTTAEIKHLLDEMADAGVFILTLSGGEIFLRSLACLFARLVTRKDRVASHFPGSVSLCFPTWFRQKFGIEFEESDFETCPNLDRAKNPICV